MDQIGPWRRKRSRVAYENAWLRVEHHEVLTPAGSEGIYGKVCFKNTAVGIVPLDESGHTWLVRQYRYPLECYSWEIPEGGCPLGQSPVESAHRELAEETGLRAGKMCHLLNLHTTNSVSDEAAQVFVALDLEEGEQRLEETEDIVVRRLPVADAINMALRGDISDAISVAALLRIQVALQSFNNDVDMLLAFFYGASNDGEE